MRCPRFPMLRVATATFLLLISAGVAHALPDLQPEIFDAEVVVADVDPDDVTEGCAGGPTGRRLVRFGLRTRNIGQDDLVLGDPMCPTCLANPGAVCGNPIFVCSIAHGHEHFEGFAAAQLFDAGSALVAEGRKQSFCLLDSECATPQFNCSFQGITVGCADVYGAGLPCQYIDITGLNLPAGSYTLRVTVDPDDEFAEADEGNNFAEVPVTLGEPPDPCGNGTVDSGETCDDGEMIAGDGCDASCQVEACHTCSGAPSTCVLDAQCARCRRAVAKEAARLALGRAKILTSCEIGRIKGRHDDPCPDPTGDGTGRQAADKIAKAVSRFESKVARTCGGEDRTCGGDLTGEVPPSLMQFPAACPGMVGGNDPSCTQTIDDCGDLTSCIACLQRTAIDRTAALIFGDLIPSDPRAARTLNRCQREIGRESHRLFAKGLAERAKCWEARRKGRHGDDCPDASASSTSAAARAATKLARALVRHEQKLCKRCGGADKICSAAPDDLDPQTEIGFPSTCDDVTIPGGASCGGAVTTLQELVDCAACVSEYYATCVNSALVPEYLSYPAECVP